MVDRDASVIGVLLVVGVAKVIRGVRRIRNWCGHLANGVGRIRGRSAHFPAPEYLLVPDQGRSAGDELSRSARREREDAEPPGRFFAGMVVPHGADAVEGPQ